MIYTPAVDPRRRQVLLWTFGVLALAVTAVGIFLPESGASGLVVFVGIALFGLAALFVPRDFTRRDERFLRRHGVDPGRGDR